MLRFHEKRARYFVNGALQSEVLWHVVLFWLAGVAAYAGFVAIFRVFPESFASGQGFSDRMWYHMTPVILSSIAVIPLLFFMAIRFSHRFVGPMIRFQYTVNELLDGRRAPKVVLRDGDFWEDFAGDMNRLSARFRELNDAVRRADEEASRRQETSARAQPESGTVADDGQPVDEPDEQLAAQGPAGEQPADDEFAKC